MSVSVDFSTIPEMFDRVTTKYATGNRPMLMHKVGKQYKGTTYAKCRRRVELFAFGLVSLGVKKVEKVAIISENRPEWVLADMGIVVLGAVDVPIYPTLTPPQIAYILNDSEVKIVIVSNAIQLGKILKIDRESQARGPSDDHLHFRNDGKSQRCDADTPQPLLEHQSRCRHDPTERTRHTSFVPPSMSLVRTHGRIYTAMACGATVAYAESTETVSDNLLEVRPTVVTTVPRLFERIYTRIMKQVDNSPPARQRIFRWAVSVGKKYVTEVKREDVSPVLRLQQALAERLVFSKLKRKTGGRIRFFVSG